MAIQKCTSPKGNLEWVNITGEGKENMSGKMQYVAGVVLDPENVEVDDMFIDSISNFWEENKPKDQGKKKPKSLGFYPHTVKTEETDDEGKPVYEPTGKILVQFKTGVTYAPKAGQDEGDPKVVRTYNSKAKEVSLGSIKIGNGSIGQISGAMGIYENRGKTGKKALLDAGVTLYLDGIKISKLVEYNADSGFTEDEEEDEGGFTGVGQDEDFDQVSEEPAKPRI